MSNISNSEKLGNITNYSQTSIICPLLSKDNFGRITRGQITWFVGREGLGWGRGGWVMNLPLFPMEGGLF